MCVGTSLANILGERTPCKKLVISTLDKVIYFRGTIILWSAKPLFISQNRVEASSSSSSSLLDCRVGGTVRPVE
jgi:hypothetical protein